MVRSTAGPPPSPFSPADWLAGSAHTQRESEGRHLMIMMTMMIVIMMTMVMIMTMIMTSRLACWKCAHPERVRGSVYDDYDNDDDQDSRLAGSPETLYDGCIYSLA